MADVVVVRAGLMYQWGVRALQAMQAQLPRPTLAASPQPPPGASTPATHAEAQHGSRPASEAASRQVPASAASQQVPSSAAASRQVLAPCEASPATPSGTTASPSPMDCTSSKQPSAPGAAGWQRLSCSACVLTSSRPVQHCDMRATCMPCGSNIWPHRCTIVKVSQRRRSYTVS